jgi:hypothetical protein
LRIAATLRLGDWEKARSVAQLLKDDQAKRLTTNLLERAQLEYFNKRRRSPEVACFLSAFAPGAGYFLGDRPQTAVAALILNGLWIWSTVELLQKRLYGPGITVSLIGLGWYAGSIRGSVKSVDTYNAKQQARIGDRLIADLPGFRR